ncbi:MAG: hypothetical protein LBM75_06290 [Myxococcales bacterium]|jgi:predicted  nucleic acid-binding Zn-ribbon protein|nr:hypothetical protein [Myxococcales bacterium]
MRKAFSANVSTARPKTRLGALLSSPPTSSQAAEDIEVEPKAAAESLEEMAVELPTPSSHDTIVPMSADVASEIHGHGHDEAQTPVVEPLPVEPIAAPLASSSASPSKAPSAAAQAEPENPIEDSKTRRALLKERIKAATSPVAVSQPTPQTATEARTSALALIAALRHELEEVKTVNAAMSKDLDQVRNELTRAAEEARSRTEEANRMAAEVKERSQLLEHLGLELSSLEAERDDVLVELRGARNDFSALKQAYAELEQRLSACEAELAETLGEEERLAADLEFQMEAQRRSEKALRAVEQERDTLFRQVEELSKERASLIESQRALDEIHRALADARSRIL